MSFMEVLLLCTKIVFALVIIVVGPVIAIVVAVGAILLLKFVFHDLWRQA